MDDHDRTRIRELEKEVSLMGRETATLTAGFKAAATDIAEIREGQKWATRLIMGQMLVTIIGLATYLLTR